jgi:hypothetical protein
MVLELKDTSTPLILVSVCADFTDRRELKTMSWISPSVAYFCSKFGERPGTWSKLKCASTHAHTRTNYYELVSDVYI